MGQLRFLVAACFSGAWFVIASLISVVDALLHSGDLDITHRYASRLSRGYSWILHLKYDIRNRERLLDNQPCVYIANHTSNLDVATMSIVFERRTLIIGKHQVLRIPLLGTIFKRGGNIAIVREDKADSQAGITAAASAIVERMVSIFVFPEGTRNFGTLRRFKKGAFHLARKAEVPIVPIVCSIAPGWLDPKRLYLRRETLVKISILEPIEPMRFESVDLLIAQAEGVIREELARLEAEP